MNVAVITPYHREDLSLIRRCHDSVLAQTVPVRHFLVADGFPRREIDAWDADHLTLSRSHADFGNTPRSVGSMSALNS